MSQLTRPDRHKIHNARSRRPDLNNVGNYYEAELVSFEVQDLVSVEMRALRLLTLKLMPFSDNLSLICKKMPKATWIGQLGPLHGSTCA